MKRKEQPASENCPEGYFVEPESNGDVLLGTPSKKKNFTEWVLDYGYTYHIHPHRDWFSAYEPLDFGVILMGNDIQCSVAGIGIVQIKTHDGVWGL